jgi:glycosyltransferase involved in cell wall biosynthesis
MVSSNTATQTNGTAPSVKSEQGSVVGVNMSGYFKATSGLGEGGRATVRALKAAQIPFVLNNCNFNLEYHDADRSFTDFSDDNPHPVNLVQINADAILRFFDAFGTEYFDNRYNIGIWLWEMLEFPPEWYYAFNSFNEVWTPSSFCVESISAVSPIPVVKIPLAIDLPTPTFGRAHFNLPADKFIFLFVFDFCSAYERKNPVALLKAFQKAFGRDNKDVLLLIKSSNADFEPAKAANMRALADNAPNVKFIDKIMPREEVNALLYNCDSYVSLHRAEGFGLTPAEAMFYGKPVIATDYSATTDFLNVSNGYPVKFRLEKLKENAKVSLYRAGNAWAEADVEHAAQMMRFVFENQSEAKRTGEKAAADIRELLSPEAVGNKIKARLQRIAYLNNNFEQDLNAETVEQKLRFSRVKLEHKDAENHQLREKVRLMEASRFWKIRTQWFALKRGLGLTRKF